MSDEELAAWGITRADLPDEDAPENTDFPVFPENWEAVLLFCGLAWRAGPWGGYLGLDYPSAETELRINRIKDRAAMWRRLKIMERTALPILNERLKKK